MEANGKPINTRRWEAWREGIEDYLYIHLLDRALSAGGVEEERARAGRKLIADFCDLYETQTDHAYLGDRRKGWLVSAADARLSEAYRRQLAAEILQWQE